ncbi:hypothetical protein ACFWBC_36390 [Streptomyces sp. NPDC059985]|uniref:hypothetical protein n=1 Tax=Streptomyces sp. NPDC059985 TaxID=3347025 RepID=UPI00369266AD
MDRPTQRPPGRRRGSPLRTQRDQRPRHQPARRPAQLDRLAFASPTDWHGPFVFACLLHLLGREEGARFWWQFAAGADSALATHCLFLDHARSGEYHDAELWAHRAAHRD